MFKQHQALLAGLAVVFSLVMITGCQKSGTEEAIKLVEQPVAGSAESWDEFVNRQTEEHLVAHPQFAVVQGRHEFDGQLPDWSRAGIEAEIARLHAVKDAALAFPDDQLSAEQRYQREYLVSRIDQDLFWSEKARWPFRNPGFYMGWLGDSLDPSSYITLDYAPIEQRMAAFTLYLANVPLAVQQIRENLEMPMPQTWLQLGIDAFGGYADYFRNDVPAIWAAVEDAELQASFTAANSRS